MIDGKEWNVRDAVRLQLALDGKVTALEQVCEDGALPVPITP